MTRPSGRAWSMETAYGHRPSAITTAGSTFTWETRTGASLWCAAGIRAGAGRSLCGWCGKRALSTRARSGTRMERPICPMAAPGPVPRTRAWSLWHRSRQMEPAWKGLPALFLTAISPSPPSREPSSTSEGSGTIFLLRPAAWLPVGKPCCVLPAPGARGKNAS